MADWTFESASPAATRRAGERLGRVLEAGDVVLLHGDLGAGKTCFVQGLALGLGVARERRVASPTFTIMNEHPGRVALHHVDLYRIEGPAELVALGVSETLGGDGVVVVEWAERLGELTPRDRIDVRFEVRSARSRRLRVDGAGQAAARARAWRTAMESAR